MNFLSFARLRVFSCYGTVPVRTGSTVLNVVTVVVVVVSFSTPHLLKQLTLYYIY